MSKYVKDLITDDLKKRLDGVNDAAAGERGRPGREQERRAAQASCARRTSSCWWSRTAWPAGRPKGRRWRRRSRASRARWRWSGAARTSSRWPRKSSDIAERQGVRAVRAARRRDGRRAAVGRRSRRRSASGRAAPSSSASCRARFCAPGANLSAQLARPRQKLASQIKKKGEGAKKSRQAEAAGQRDAAAAEAPPAAGERSYRTRLSK